MVNRRIAVPQSELSSQDAQAGANDTNTYILDYRIISMDSCKLETVTNIDTVVQNENIFPTMLQESKTRTHVICWF